jgi:hypothetical protein
VKFKKDKNKTISSNEEEERDDKKKEYREGVHYLKN